MRSKKLLIESQAATDRTMTALVEVLADIRSVLIKIYKNGIVQPAKM